MSDNREPDKRNLSVAVTNFSAEGFWILVGEDEYFLSFENFPAFKFADISDIRKVTVLENQHLFWEKLDIDLTLDMIKNPGEYPSVSEKS